MRFIILPALLLLALVVPNLHAQSNQLEKSQMAVVSFDIRMDKIRESNLANTLDLEGKMKNAMRFGKNTDPNNLKRIFGASSAPESMESAKSYKGNGPLPVEAFIRIELVDSEAADTMMEELKDKGEAVEVSGHTYYKSTEERAPDNFLVHRVDGTTVEVGTEAYLLRSDRKVFTDGLTEAWGKAPDEAIKIAFDLAGAEKLVGELEEMAADNIPPNFAAFSELIGAISGMHLTADMDGPNLLTIGVTGKSESEAEQLEEGLGSLVGIGQMFGMGAVGNLKQQSPELGGMVEKILTSLKAERGDGSNDVSIKLIHPEGLGEALQGMMGN